MESLSGGISVGGRVFVQGVRGSLSKGGGEDLCPGAGVSGQRGLCPGGGGSLSRGERISVHGVWGSLSRGDLCQGHPPMNGMTHSCKNITLPQTSFAGGKKLQFIG